MSILKFPNKCVRCGFCCLSENCIISQQLFQIPKRGLRCPALSFNENDKAECGLLAKYGKEILGIGKGCCISARAIKDGIEYDFASLPSELKIKIAKEFK